MISLGGRASQHPPTLQYLTLYTRWQRSRGPHTEPRPGGGCCRDESKLGNALRVPDSAAKHGFGNDGEASARRGGHLRKLPLALLYWPWRRLRYEHDNGAAVPVAERRA